MALADYFGRNSIAASQIISGFDESEFIKAVGSLSIGVAFGKDCARSSEGRNLLDLLIRLIARFYPMIVFLAQPGSEDLVHELTTLARSINPKIEMGTAKGVHRIIAVGTELPDLPENGTVLYAGSDEWDAHISELSAQAVGNSTNPFGAGAAAALACAKVFNSTFGQPSEAPLFSDELTFSTLDGSMSKTAKPPSLDSARLFDRTVLVGLGAIGNAVVWALSRSKVSGSLHLVDHEQIELSNLQRYVLALRNDEKTLKASHLAANMSGSIRPEPVALNWESFVSDRGYAWDQAIVALDSARDRRAVQSSLPHRVVNAWTQAGDLGISEHGVFGGEAACVSCLYLPSGTAPSEDQLVAQALQLMDRLLDVRKLLHLGDPVPDEMLDLIGERLGIEPGLLTQFRGLPIRRLYVDGLCGGALVKLGRADIPRELHVPVAHQSALAGILLAAAALRQILAPSDETTSITRFDVMNPNRSYQKQLARADQSGVCICRDSDYVQVFNKKYRAIST